MVESAFLQKGIVIAHFHDVAVLHHEDEIGIFDGGKAVRHDEGGLAFHQLFKSVADLELGTGKFARILTAIMKCAILSFILSVTKRRLKTRFFR